LWSFGIFLPFWYVAPRKIWQPWSPQSHKKLFFFSHQTKSIKLHTRWQVLPCKPVTKLVRGMYICSSWNKILFRNW
jgi:hypothetical protein